MMALTNELVQNLKALQEQLPRLLAEAGGRLKYAVGRAGDSFNLMDTYSDAITYGYERYGLEPFIAQSINSHSEVFTRNFVFA